MNTKAFDELQQKRQELKEFFKSLDNQNLLFKDYVKAVKDRFNCTGSQAGKMIMRHLHGDY